MNPRRRLESERNLIDDIGAVPLEQQRRRETEGRAVVFEKEKEEAGLLEEEEEEELERRNDVLQTNRDEAEDREEEGGMDEEDPVVVERRNKVKEMAKHAWDGYVKYAWGDNELKPISKKGHSASVFGKTKLGATIVDSLDTLYIMGLHDEFNQAREWVELSLNINEVRSDVSVFEFNIRFIGGLLSAYGLSRDKLFLDKSVEIAKRLLPAFNTPSGIPKSIVNLGTGAIKNWGWASGGSSVLAEFGSLHLEFQYLTELTGDPIYLDKVSHVRKHLKELTKPDGLYPNFLNPNTGNWGTKHVSLGALGDSFYEYLLKSWLVTSKEDTEARDMYYEAMEALERHLVRKAGPLTYLSDLKNGRPDSRMQHLACFAGGMFALGGVHATNGQTQHYLDLAAELAKTCHESYQNTATKLGPEAFRLDAGGKMTSRNNEKMYLLRPETVETYFVLWRLTHDQKYRDWGWEVVQALEQTCRIDTGGYTGIKDVFSSNPVKDDVQQSFVIAETLKYLYLLYCDDDVIPLDEYVFNTEAHPLPVIAGVPNTNSSREA